MALKIGENIPEDILNVEIKDEQGKQIKLGTILTGRPTLITFMRHFGCFGCIQQLVELSPRLQELNDLGLNVIAIGNGESHYIANFKESLNLNDKPIQIYTDPSLQIYQKVELHRSAWRVFNPLTYWQMIVALSKGIKKRTIEGDGMQLGGTLFVCERGTIKFYFKNKSISGHADPNTIFDVVLKHVASSQKI